MVMKVYCLDLLYKLRKLNLRPFSQGLYANTCNFALKGIGFQSTCDSSSFMFIFL